MHTGISCRAGANFHHGRVLSPSPAVRPLRIAFSLFFITLCLSSTSAFADAAEPEREAWQAIANLRITDALRELKDAPSGRATSLAQAVALITQQPSADENMAQAEQILLSLSAGDDQIAEQAAYLQARLYQLHYKQPDYAKAAQLYEALATRHPQSHWAQLGLVKLAQLKLYVLPESTAPDADRLAPAEALLPRIHDSLLQRDLHLQIGQAGVILKQPLPRFVPHLEAAARAGGIGGTAGEDLVIQVGELSFRAGFLAQAKAYFQRYLKEYPTNVRAYAATQRIAEIDRRLAAAGGSAP